VSGGLHQDAVAALSSWSAPGAAQDALRTTYLDHLRRHDDALTRDCHPDHLTASTLVVSPDRSRVLLNLHGKYAIWTQFGGHCEPGDQTLAGAALREAVEESGVDELQLVLTEPVQLSTHEVRCGPIRPSHHLDVRYVAVAPPAAAHAVSTESLDVRWFNVDALPAELDEPLRELITLATRL
jgi:8-oxo-dGTP pyrophosphatase MutT (NUDIX family)